MRRRHLEFSSTDSLFLRREMLAVNATGLDYILWDYIGPQVPRERREDFALRYGAMLDKILTRLKVRSLSGVLRSCRGVL